MNRLGLLHPSTLTGKHNTEASALYRALSDHAYKEHGTGNSTWKLASTGALVGPYGALLHTPHVGRAYLNFCSALRELPGLSPRTREIIALVVAAYENAAYQFYFHGRMAVAEGLSQNELDSLRAGLYAQTFSEQDQAAYRIARELCAVSGPLTDKCWRQGVAVLGRDGALAAVHYTGFCRYVSTIVRGFDAQLPPPAERIETQG